MDGIVVSEWIMRREKGHMIHAKSLVESCAVLIIVLPHLVTWLISRTECASWMCMFGWLMIFLHPFESLIIPAASPPFRCFRNSSKAGSSSGVCAEKLTTWGSFQLLRACG